MKYYVPIFYPFDSLATNFSLLEYYFASFIVLVFFLFILMLIYLLASSSQAAETSDTQSDSILTRIPPDNRCDHEWKENNVNYTCGYKVRGGEDSCSISRPVTWRCSKCGEVRCVTHAQKHYRHNAGGAFKGNVSP